MIHILLVDDQNFTRQALNVILEPESDFKVLGEAENGVKALELMNQMADNVDIAIVDLDMPKMDGFELTEKIRHRFPETKVIILSSHEDKQSINKAVNCGARGYLLKNSSAKEIVDTIHYVQRGYFQLGPGLFEKLISNLIDDEVETSDRIAQLEVSVNQYFVQLKQENKLQQEENRHQLFEELNVQLERLKLEFRQGLYVFQNQVSEQVNDGLDILTNSPQNYDFNPEFWEQRYYKFNQKINSVENTNKFYLKKLEKEIVILRYGLVFLLVVFFMEKVVLLLLRI